MTDESKAQRRPNRTISEKLASLADSRRAQLTKLEARAAVLHADLARVRAEIDRVTDEVRKLEQVSAGVTTARAAE